MIKVKRLNLKVPAPERKSQDAAGFDLHAPYEINLYPGEQVKVKTGFAWELPFGSVGMLKPRSSKAILGLEIPGGIIDSDYRGEVIALVRNDSNNRIKIEQGERFAQMLVLWLHPSGIDAGVEEVAELSETHRGVGGFGSTGTHS